MSDIVIEAERLGKKYMIGHQAEAGSYLALRDVIMQNARGLWQKTRDLVQGKPIISGDTLEEVWALKDVSFEIRRGEAVGIIGRNGAGKSTLLKILSRITEPSAGRVTIKGRVASLLEVGTGFHPELTGRENIYLNGAILGMGREEIKRKFDEIVAFAEIERFLDTPVKRFSSGMYVRLAFAVAAHLEPEILLVDEVLAVGDAAFQQKCLGKMGSVAVEGRTVLFVSHNMAAIRHLCPRTVLIQDGSVRLDGFSDDVIGEYSRMLSSDLDYTKASNDVTTAARARGDGSAKITNVSIKRESGELATSFLIWEPVIIDLTIHCSDHSRAISAWVLVYSSAGDVVLSSFQYDSLAPVRLVEDKGTLRVHMDPNGLAPGRYRVSAGVFGRYNEFSDWVDDVIGFSIEREFTTGRSFDQRLGLTSLRYRWEVLP